MQVSSIPFDLCCWVAFVTCGSFGIMRMEAWVSFITDSYVWFIIWILWLFLWKLGFECPISHRSTAVFVGWLLEFSCSFQSLSLGWIRFWWLIGNVYWKFGIWCSGVSSFELVFTLCPVFVVLEVGGALMGYETQIFEELSCSLWITFELFFKYNR